MTIRNLLLPFLFLFFKLYSQTYQYKPLLNNTDWKVRVADLSFSEDSFYYHKAFEITTIGKTYSVITDCDGLDPLFYLRESSNKVYYMNTNETIEHLLFDFNLKVGDSMEIPIYLNYNWAEPYKVIKIDTIIAQDGKHKRFTFKPLGNFTGNPLITIIEGFGCIGEPFKIRSRVSDPDYFLKCVFKGLNCNYNNGNCQVNECYNPASINSVYNQNIDKFVFPNPAVSFIKINSNLIKKYEIFDSYGRLIKQELYDQKINIEELPLGYYYLNLISEEMNFKTSFIKQ